MAVIFGAEAVDLRPRARSRATSRSRTTEPSVEVFRRIVAELLGSLKARLDGDGGVELLRLRGRQAADLARRNLRVLRLHGRGHVGHGQLVAVELHRIDPDPHRILRAEQLEAADAVDAADRLLDLGHHHVGEVVLVVRAVGRIKAGDEREIGRRFLDPDALALNFLRQERERRLDLVLDLDLRGVGIGALLEGQGDGDLARRRGLGREIAQVVDALQLLLDDLGRRLVERRGVGARDRPRRR